MIHGPQKQDVPEKQDVWRGGTAREARYDPPMIRMPVMNKTLRYTLIAAGAVVVLVLALPFLVPMDAYRGRIEDATASATGRTLKIEGPLRLMIFPHFGLRAQNVTFANMPGGRARAMATAGEIKLSVKVLPLLTGRVALDKIVLEKPTIALEVSKQGDPNWKFAKSGEENAPSKGESSVTLPSGTEFSGIEIDDGRITYDNAKSGTHRSIEHVNANIAVTRLDKPITVDGNMVIGEGRIDFIARIETLKELLSNGTAAVDLSATSEMLQASFKGQLKPNGGVDGTFKLDTTDFRGVASWFGESLPPGNGLKGLSLESRLVSQDKVSTLSPIRVTLDGQHMNGKLTYDQRTKIPALYGVLTVDHLDLNPYLAAPGHKETPPPQKTATGWSKAPLSLALLKKFDGKLMLTVGSLRVRNMKLGKTALNVMLAGGMLTATLDPVTLYGGTGRARLDIDVRGSVPTFRNSLAFDKVALRPLLTDMLGLDSIEGSGSLNLEVSAQGSNTYAVMHALSGKGALNGANGRFRGVDLGLVARTIQNILGGGATGDVASTQFHQMGATFVISRGVLASNDFRLAGPAVQMTGAGTVNIGERTIDFRMVPSTANVGVPFKITGSWDHVRYSPDLKGIIGGVMQNLKSGSAPFKGLFGGGSQKNEKDKNGKKKKSTGDALKDIFGIH